MKIDDLKKFLSRHPVKVPAIGIPFDENCSYIRGPAGAPNEVEKFLFLESTNPWSETGIDLKKKGGFSYLGTIDFDGKKSFEVIENVAELAFYEKRTPIFIGGDHSITFPLMKGVAKHHKGITILHIDAHPDLYDDYEGNPFSHASPFARIMEAGLAKRLIQIGIRTSTNHMRDQVKRFGVEQYEMALMQEIPNLEFDGPVYMTIDMDGLDPAFAPGVSHREPGGLSSREVINLIHRAGPHLIGGDVVEYNPRCDLDHVTAMVTARLVREMAGAMLLKG